MRLDIGTVLLQWSAGGLLGCWVTTRRRILGIGYGWLLRSIFGTLAVVGAAAGLADPSGGAAGVIRDAAGIAIAGSALVALVTSVRRRGAGLVGPGAFDPRLDLAALFFGVVALVAGAAAAGGSYPLTASRLVAGALLLGFVTDAMLLGHWYLVQPGLSRGPIKELVLLTAIAWLLDVGLLLVPTGMVDVVGGRIDDGYGGLLAALWMLSALTTIVLLGVTWRALAEPYYSAVMASTGLLYLAILTSFGTDVLARALLAS